MIVDEITAEVERRMGASDERTKQAVTLALQLSEQQGLPKWQGENPTWDEWQKMSEEERQATMDELEQRNRVWLERMRQALRAEWLLVADGEREVASLKPFRRHQPGLRCPRRSLPLPCRAGENLDFAQ